MNKIFYILLFVTLFLSCGEYQKAIKSEDSAVKLDIATQLYEAEKYDKAIRLFEQIATEYRGKPQAEKMFYMYSQALYKTEQHYLAGYQFESFVALYPKSDKLQEAAFLAAKSYSFMSAEYSLDQVDTEKALTKMQTFIDTYTTSEYLPEANIITKSLLDKLEKKAFEIAKQYNTISDYKASIKALDNFISDYPGTIYKEKALYYKLDSSYQLAINSVEYKKQERLNNAKAAHASLLKFKADTEFRDEAENMLERIEQDLQKYSK